MIYEACKVSAPTASNYAPASPASNSSAAPTASNSAPAPTASNSSASDRDGITALLHTKYGKRHGYMPVTRKTIEYASNTTHLLDASTRDFTPLFGDVDLRDINLDGIHKVTGFDEIDRDAIVSFLKQIQLEQSTPVSAPPSNMSAASAPVSNMSAASAPVSNMSAASAPVSNMSAASAPVSNMSAAPASNSSAAPAPAIKSQRQIEDEVICMFIKDMHDYEGISRDECATTLREHGYI